MAVELCGEPFDPWRAIERHQKEAFGTAGPFGATAVFVGTMRDFNEGQEVRSMVLEHYPGMTQKHLASISAEARSRWEILDSLIVHRYGTVEPGDPIVMVAIWSAHRAAALDACRYLIEELKSRAPFWKKESLQQGERWVAKNTPG